MIEIDKMEIHLLWNFLARFASKMLCRMIIAIVICRLAVFDIWSEYVGAAVLVAPIDVGFVVF